MIKVKKSKVLFVATASLFAGTLFSAVTLLDVNADVTAYTVDQVTNAQTGSFKMAEGASVRNISNDAASSGLRYAVTLSEAHYEGLMQSVENGVYDSVEFGVFVLPYEYNQTFQVRDYAFCAEEDVKYNWAVRNTVTGEWEYTPEEGKVRITNLSGNAMNYNEEFNAMAFYGTIVNVLPVNMGTEMVGVGYIAYTVDGVTNYVFTDEAEEATNVRTMAYVAQATIDLGDANAEWLRETYIKPVLDAGTQYEYVTEYYFENGIGEFVLDETKTKVEKAALEANVTAFEQGFKGYVFDEDNAGNVATGKVVALNGATVLKRYYSKVVPTTENVTLTAVKDFELSRATVTTLDINIAQYADAGEIASVSLVNGGAETTFTANDYTVDGNVVKVNVSAIGANNFGKDLTVKVTLEEKDENETVTNYTVIAQPVSTVSMVIRNADDLDAMPGIADGLLADANGKKLDGYFVLGNNVDYTEGNANRVYVGLAGFTPTDWIGFDGTLDGRGFAIDHFTVGLNNEGWAGLFVSVGQYGKIKNVSFTNAVNTTTSGFLSTKMSGLIENVFVHYAKSVNPATGLSWKKIGGTFASTGNNGSMQIKNCMVIVDEFGGAYNTLIGGIADHSASIINNVYAIGSDYAHTATSDGTFVPGIYDFGGSYGWANYKMGAYATVEGFKNSVTINESEWSTDFWTVVNGIPMPKNLTLDTPELVQPDDGKVFADDKVKIEYNPVYQTVTVAGKASFEKGFVVVDSDAVAGNQIVITVTDVLSGESVQATLTVKQTITKELAYVEMGNNKTGIDSWVNYKRNTEVVAGYTYKTDYAYSENYTVDLTAYGLGSVTSAKVGGVDVLASTNATQFSFAKSAITARGEVLAVVSGLTSDGGEVQINMPLVLADILISTADDFEAMQWLADPYAADVNSAYGIQVVKSAGYIVLTNNIAYNRTYKVHERSHACTVDIDGFTGTLDGRGFVVDGLEMVEQKNAANNYTAVFQGFETSKGSLAGSGLFAMLGAGGTIKNIGFTNAKHSCGGGFIVTTARGGNNTIENVYVHITTALGTKHTAGQWNYMNASGVLNGWYHGGSFTVRNIVIKVDAVTEGNVYYTLGSFSNPGPTASNVYVISPLTTLISRTNAWGVDGNSIGTTHTGVTVYANAEAATSGKAAWSAGLTSSVWNTTGDLPVFASTVTGA